MPAKCRWQDLPPEVLRYLLASRYCEVDRLLDCCGRVVRQNSQPGWARVQAVCDWVQTNVTFGYHFASPTKTALDVYADRRGVCRDFQHLAITFCRCLNIPARYATGYLGDIGVPVVPPMDFSAWFEAYLRGSLVDIRCAQQQAANWPSADGHRARCGGRRDNNFVRNSLAEKLYGCHG